MSHIIQNRLGGVTGFVRGLVVATVVLATGGSTARADDEAPSNLTMMTNLTTEVVSELLDRMGSRFDTANGVRLSPFASNERYQFLTNLVTSVFTDRGIRTYPPGAAGTATPTEAELGLRLEFKYQTISYGVSYTKVYRSHLIGGRKVKRSTDVRILATLVDPKDGSVAWIGEADRAVDDHFGYGELEEVEEGDFQFMRPELPSSGWGKYAEPVLVSGIVVGLIYLFFSNQSDN